MGWLVLVALGFFQTTATTASPQCLRTYGKTVCGYSCLAAHGEISCAQTPRGICGASQNGVVCWDAPDEVVAHYGARAPFPKCLARNGHTECGYHCTAHDEDVRCAQTPDGICRATSLGVFCWDPPPSTYCADDRSLPRPKCVVLDERVTCGYACEARNGQMACAQTPSGVCQVTPEGIFCSDPEPPALSASGEVATDTRPWCPAPRR